MKNKILSFVLIVSMLSSMLAINVSAAEKTEESMPVDIRSAYCYYDEGKVTASIKFDGVDEAGTVLLAIYDEGKLVTISQKLLSVDDQRKSIEITNVDESYIGYEAGIFCWGGEHLLTPIAIPVKVQITDYATEMVRRLTAVSSEIALYTDRSNPDLYTIFNNQERYILENIKVCIDDAVANHADELDADFIKNTYKAEIGDVHGVYDEMVEAGKDDAFIGKLAANFTVENLVWLADTLDVDLEKYGIDVSKFI